MPYEQLYKATAGDHSNNNYFIKLSNGYLHEEIHSACFSILHRWKKDVEWIKDVPYDPEQHAPLRILYYPNYRGILNEEEYGFWMETLLEHPLVNRYVDCHTPFSSLGFISISSKLEHNYLLHLLGMLRAMREFPEMCQAAYRLFNKVETCDEAKNRKLARLILYLGTQFYSNGDLIQYYSRDGCGGHDPAGDCISQLDIALYVKGHSAMGGVSLHDDPSYNNISCGLYYHSVPSYGLRRKTMESLASKLNDFLVKYDGDLNKVDVDKLTKFFDKMLVELDGLLAKHAAVVEEKAAKKEAKKCVKGALAAKKKKKKGAFKRAKKVEERLKALDVKAINLAAVPQPPAVFDDDNIPF